MHTCTHSLVCMGTCRYIQAIQVHVRTCMVMYIVVHTGTYRYMQVHTYVYIQVCMCACRYVCMCTYRYIQYAYIQVHTVCIHTVHVHTVCIHTGTYSIHTYRYIQYAYIQVHTVCIHTGTCGYFQLRKCAHVQTGYFGIVLNHMCIHIV